MHDRPRRSRACALAFIALEPRVALSSGDIGDIPVDGSLDPGADVPADGGPVIDPAPDDPAVADEPPDWDGGHFPSVPAPDVPIGPPGPA